MSENSFDWDKEFADDPDYQSLTPEMREKLLSVMEKMMDMGMAAVYGDEEDHAPDAAIDCLSCITHCRAKCCTLVFALTKEEAGRGNLQYNKERPYFIARDDDGYCPHLNRESMQCDIWQDRPLRCRRYSCRNDKNVWPYGLPDALLEN